MIVDPDNQINFNHIIYIEMNNFKKIFGIFNCKLLFVIVMLLVLNEIFWGNQILHWSTSIYWHLFNSEIKFHEMIIDPPLRWRVVDNEKPDRIYLSMVPNRNINKFGFVALEKKDGITNEIILRLAKENKLITRSEIVIDELEDIKIGGEKALLIVYNIKVKSDYKNVFNAIIVLQTKGFYIDIDNFPIEYKPYLSSLLSSISFQGEVKEYTAPQ